jgi:hypothetical protein
LFYILKNLAPAKETIPGLREEIIPDYIGDWDRAFEQQLLTFPPKSLRQFLTQCKEFSSIVWAFCEYVGDAQRRLAADAKPLDEYVIDRLEEFREEYKCVLQPSDRQLPVRKSSFRAISRSLPFYRRRCTSMPPGWFEGILADQPKSAEHINK